MMTHSMVLTNVVIKTSKIFKQRCGIWQDGASAKEMTLTALVHRPPRVAVLGAVENCKLSITIHELLAAYCALNSFTSDVKNKHIKLMIDNTAVAVINHMGTNHSSECNASVIKMQSFCVKYNMWVTACHIPRNSNGIADRESRQFSQRDDECMLNKDVPNKMKILPRY